MYSRWQIFGLGVTWGMVRIIEQSEKSVNAEKNHFAARNQLEKSRTLPFPACLPFARDIRLFLSQSHATMTDTTLRHCAVRSQIMLREWSLFPWATMVVKTEGTHGKKQSTCSALRLHPATHPTSLSLSLHHGHRHLCRRRSCCPIFNAIVVIARPSSCAIHCL